MIKWLVKITMLNGAVLVLYNVLLRPITEGEVPFPVAIGFWILASWVLDQAEKNARKMHDDAL